MRRHGSILLGLAIAIATTFPGSLVQAGDVGTSVIIHLNTGGIVKGEVVSESDEEVRVRTPSGVATVFREDIERIERLSKGGSPTEAFKERLAKLSPKDANGFYELGQWAKKVRLDKEAKEAFERTVAVDPNHTAARRELGHVLREGAWVTPEAVAAAEALVATDKGDDGAAEVEVAAAKAVAPRAGQIARERQDLVKSLLKEVRDADPAKRRAAYERIGRLEAEAIEASKAKVFGDDAATRAAWAKGCLLKTPAEALIAKVSDAPATLTAEERATVEAALAQSAKADVGAPVVAGLTAFEATVRRRLEKEVKKLEQTVPDRAKKEQDVRGKVLVAWEKAVEEAIKTIFDLKIYPDENHGRVGQPIVDEKVEAVRAVWATYDPLVLRDLSKLQALPEKNAKAFIDAHELGWTALGEVRQALEALGAPVQKPAPAPAGAAYRAFLLYRAGYIGKAWELASELSSWDKRLLERLRDQRVEAHNDRLTTETAPLEKGKRPTNDERNQVRITNAYRIMMGRHALEIHPCLVESARGHSQEMTQLGYFAHESPVAKNRSPSDRARNAGYPGGAAENIAMGSISPQAAHDAWYNSSGHHRNILDKGHQVMGSGFDGPHWTQNFGHAATLQR